MSGEIVFLERFANQQADPVKRVLTAIVNSAALAAEQFEPWALANGMDQFSFPDFALAGNTGYWALCGNSVRLALRLAAVSGVCARRVTLVRGLGDYHEVVSLNGTLVDPSYGRVYGEFTAIAAEGGAAVEIESVVPPFIADVRNHYLRSTDPLLQYFRGICLWEHNGSRSYLLNHALSDSWAVATALECRVFQQ